MQYYQIENDTTGRLLLRHLRDAALRGVRVRLLVDDLYTARGRTRCCAAWRRSPTSRCACSTRSAAAATAASPAASRPRSFDFDRLNHRMHNKLFIADGVIAVAGGRNIADEYFMRSRAHNFVDMDAFVIGAVVPRLATSSTATGTARYVYPIVAVVRARSATAARAKAFDATMADVPPSR